MTGGDNKPFPLKPQPQQHSEHRGHQQRNPNEPPMMNSARMQKKNFAAHKFPSCSSISDSSSASSTLPCHASHTTYRVEITVVHPINPRVIMLIKCLSTRNAPQLLWIPNGPLLTIQMRIVAVIILSYPFCPQSSPTDSPIHAYIVILTVAYVMLLSIDLSMSICPEYRPQSLWQKTMIK